MGRTNYVTQRTRKICRKGSGMQKTITLNENGKRIGESHPRAKLTDEEVELLLELREAGHSYAWLAKKFDMSKSGVRWICVGRWRSQTIARVVRVSVA